MWFDVRNEVGRKYAILASSNLVNLQIITFGGFRRYNIYTIKSLEGIEGGPSGRAVLARGPGHPELPSIGRG